MPGIIPSVPDWPGADTDETRWLEPAIDTLAQLDGAADEAGAWPDRLWRTVVSVGGPKWSIPAEYGGEPCSRSTLLRRYARLAEGSLTAAFLLSQHDAAIRRLASASGPGQDVARTWLQQIARDGIYATVGISHLTTSRRLGERALSATPRPDGGYTIDGAMPWVTGAVHARVIVCGAFLADGQQLLIALPADRPRVRVDPAFDLAALQASCTSEIDCDAVHVEPSEILAGPSPGILSVPGQVGTGGLETSALALGQTRAALRGLTSLATSRPDLAEPAAALAETWLGLASALHDAAEGAEGALSSAQIRSRANTLVLRATQAFLTARKGTGFLRSDSAQRWARQALFFLVWSCPSPLANEVVRDLAGLCDS
jgi:alkylation response protein AidB-like acyl-CoA dehydrogenase